MTDVAPKTPNKRKSKGGASDSPKKPKLENGQPPFQKFGSAKKQKGQTPKLQNPKGTPKLTPKPQKIKNTDIKQDKIEDTPKSLKNQSTPKQQNKTPKQPKGQQTPKQQNNTPKQPKGQQTPKQQKNKQEMVQQKQKNQQKVKAEIEAVSNEGKKQKKGAPMKVKPFKGTSQVDQPKKVSKKEPQESDKSNPAKKRRTPFFSVKQKINTADANAKKEVIQDIENRIKTIEERGNLSKSAMRKIKLLKKFKKIAEGDKATPQAQTKNAHSKSESTKRRERKKNAKATEPVKTKAPVSKLNIKEEDDDDDDSEEELIPHANIKLEKSESDDESGEDEESGDEESGDEEEESGDEESDDEDGSSDDEAD